MVTLSRPFSAFLRLAAAILAKGFCHFDNGLQRFKSK
jgi:hypothetical protein